MFMSEGRHNRICRGCSKSLPRVYSVEDTRVPSSPVHNKSARHAERMA